MSKITVYYFKGYAPDKHDETLSKSMAPLEWIEKHGYKPIKETAKEIDDSALDGNGLYREMERYVVDGDAWDLGWDPDKLAYALTPLLPENGITVECYPDRHGTGGFYDVDEDTVKRLTPKIEKIIKERRP